MLFDKNNSRKEIAYRCPFQKVCDSLTGKKKIPGPSPLPFFSQHQCEKRNSDITNLINKASIICIGGYLQAQQ